MIRRAKIKNKKVFNKLDFREVFKTRKNYMLKV